jgi:hypothetical protein
MKKGQNMPVWLSKMGFDSTFLHCLLRLVNATWKLTTCQRRVQQGHTHLIVGLKTIAINHMVNLKLVSHLPMGHPSLLKDDHSFIHSFIQSIKGVT